jgi:hypothetical protein
LEDNINAIKNALSKDVVINPKHANLFSLNNLCKSLGENEKEVFIFETQMSYKRELYPPSLYSRYNPSNAGNKNRSYHSELSSSLDTNEDSSNDPIIEAPNVPKVEIMGKTIKEMSVSGPKCKLNTCACV